MYQGKYLNGTAPEKRSAEASIAPAVKTKKTSRKGTIIFYSIYGTFVLAIIVALLCLMSPLKAWLIRYEASQPESMRQQVYDQYFAQPDWGALYETAGIQDTVFEDKSSYAAYMEDKCANAQDSALFCVETSAGLSGDHKYFLKLDGEKVAGFTLVEGQSGQDGITTWELGDIELFFDRTYSVTVEKLPEHTVCINDVALDDQYTIRTVSTKAEDYLPDGVHGYQAQQQQVTGLLAAPQITVKDKNGDAVEMVMDAQTGILKPHSAAVQEITETDKGIVLNAAKNYALFAIRKISSGDLRGYMDSTSQVYKNLVQTPPFLQAFTGYKIYEDEIQISNYYRYSETLFSARVTLKMDVYAARGNTKVFEMDTTFFFKDNGNGKYLINNSTNVDTSENVGQVRLTFMNGDEQVDSFMIDSNATSVTLPKVTAPEGKVLKGWAAQSIDESGNITMTILYTPDENGVATASNPEPAILYAVFEVAA